MADINKTVAIIFQAEDKTYPTLPGLEKNLNALGNEAGGAGTKVGKLGEEVEGLGKKGAGIDGLVAGLKTLAAGLVVRDFVEANVALEKFDKAMIAATGSADLAKKEFEFVREVSNRLGIEARGTADAYSKFAAATKGSALEGENARQIFTAFAGSLSVMGASSAEISGAFVQLAQGISKGKFELEDLKSIAERFPGFFPKFAESLGLTTAALFEFISAGKITGDEILIFAGKLNEGLDDQKFEGFAASFARLRNAIDDAYIVIGESGAFDALITGLQAGSAAVVGATQVAVLLGNVLEGLFLKLQGGSNFSFGEFMSRRLDEAADKSRAARDALFGVDTASTKAGASGAEAGEKIASAFGNAEASASALKKSAADIDKQLKALGIDPKVFADPIKDIQTAFAGLAGNAGATGQQILAGLVGALKSLPPGASVSGIAAEIDKAFKGNKITADEFGQAIALIRVRLDDASPSFLKVTEAADKTKDKIKDTAKEAREAEKATRDYALELEKLASNERVKNIEAVVTLKVSDIEAQTKRIQSAFASVDNAVSSTGDLIGKLFGMFKDEGALSWRALSQIDKQIEGENKRRDDAFKLQKSLTEAQIAQMRAQTEAMSKGEGMIKIDGAGLQPHLEAFMWEILKAVQVRVNAQGLSMLLGV